MTNPFFAESTPTHLEQLPGRPMRPAAMIAVLMVASLFVPPYPVAAQETRAEAIRQEQAEKQKALAPPQPNAAERLIDRLEDWGLIAGAPRGVYPWFGSVYSGGGFAAGAGVRKPFGDDGAFNIFGGYSINIIRARAGRSGAADLRAQSARVTPDRPIRRRAGRAVLRHRQSSSKEDLTHFGYTPKGGGARLDIDGGKYFSLGGGVNYIDIETSGRQVPRRPSRSGSRRRTRQGSALQIQLHQQHGASGVRLAAAGWATRVVAGSIASSSTTTRSATTTCTRSDRSKPRCCSSFRSCGPIG